MLNIITDSSLLWKRSEEVLVVGEDGNTLPDINELIQGIKQVLIDNKDMVALSAPQVGESKRIFCVRFENGDIRTFINPMITKTDGLHLTRETNPSIPNRAFIVPRHDRIIAVYQTPMGIPEENAFIGSAADIFQQMVNLLDGVLISDFGLEVFEDFDNASQEDKNQVLDAYLAELKKKSDAMNQEIDADPDLKKTKEAIEFMKDVTLGKVKLEPKDEIKKHKKPKHKKRKKRNKR